MGDAYTKLVAEFCPPLDPALLSAIASDYSLDTPDGLRDARQTLEPLKESALIEEACGLTTSESGSPDQDWDDAIAGQSSPNTSSSSRATDLTSLSNDVASLDLGTDIAGPRTFLDAEQGQDAFENMDKEMKVDLLVEVFQGRVSSSAAQSTLKKCGGRWHAAMEELLNHVYFDESRDRGDGERVLAKGIEGFDAEGLHKGSAKKKKRTQRSKLTNRITDTDSVTYDQTPPPNRWQSSVQDIDFLASRTSVLRSSISSTYHAEGASVPKTIAALMQSASLDTKQTESDASNLKRNAQELAQDFPMISAPQITALLRLTHPSTAHAHELAKALVTPRAGPGSDGGQLLPQYIRPLQTDLDSLEDDPVLQSPSTAALSIGINPVAAERARAYAIARSTALTQAQRAYRRAKSDRLYSGATVYYGEVQRELAALSQHAGALAANDLADSRSTSASVDLHHIDVVNAKRIAQAKVEQWWNGLGENRVNGRTGAQARDTGFQIIVGRGTHSEGGKGKLGPAVSKMLRDQGWKFELAGAVIVVKGRATPIR